MGWKKVEAQKNVDCRRKNKSLLGLVHVADKKFIGKNINGLN